MKDEKYAELVKADIQEARQVGVQGVPFFVLDRKYAVSGAQPAQAFLESLTQAYTEWREKNPEIKLKVTEGQSCADRKSTRLNSSHVRISYAVFCLKKIIK